MEPMRTGHSLDVISGPTFVRLASLVSTLEASEDLECTSAKSKQLTNHPI